MPVQATRQIRFYRCRARHKLKDSRLSDDVLLPVVNRSTSSLSCRQYGQNHPVPNLALERLPYKILIGRFRLMVVSQIHQNLRFRPNLNNHAHYRGDNRDQSDHKHRVYCLSLRRIESDFSAASVNPP